jgi:hypothetical protein
VTPEGEALARTLADIARSSDLGIAAECPCEIGVRP